MPSRKKENDKYLQRLCRACVLENLGLLRMECRDNPGIQSDRRLTIHSQDSCAFQNIDELDTGTEMPCVHRSRRHIDREDIPLHILHPCDLGLYQCGDLWSHSLGVQVLARDECEGEHSCKHQEGQTHEPLR